MTGFYGSFTSSVPLPDIDWPIANSAITRLLGFLSCFSPFFSGPTESRLSLRVVGMRLEFCGGRALCWFCTCLWWKFWISRSVLVKWLLPSLCSMMA